MSGVRSSHEVMWYGVPSEVFHSTAPVAASSPYTQSVSVATPSGLPMTSGCAYTWPLTEVLKMRPNFPPCTAAGVRAGSLGSQPLRRLFWDTVVSSLEGPD